MIFGPYWDSLANDMAGAIVITGILYGGYKFFGGLIKRWWKRVY